MDILDLTNLQKIIDSFWHKPIFIVIYVFCLLLLIIFWEQMKSGRRLFLPLSLICLILFIYNPVFVNISSKFFFRENSHVTVRLFLLLPLLFTEAYVFTIFTSCLFKKNKVISFIFTAGIVGLFLVIGVAPWQREAKGWESNMYLLAENPYKIPQEHIEICEAILEDMDGQRAVLAMYEMHGKNDIGGTLNYSIRMYTSRIQLDEVKSADIYDVMPYDDRVAYWNAFIDGMMNNTIDTNSSSCYFLFPIGDERASDLLLCGCEELSVESSNYQLLVYRS